MLGRPSSGTAGPPPDLRARGRARRCRSGSARPARSRPRLCLGSPPAELEAPSETYLVPHKTRRRAMITSRYACSDSTPRRRRERSIGPPRQASPTPRRITHARRHVTRGRDGPGQAADDDHRRGDAGLHVVGPRPCMRPPRPPAEGGGLGVDHVGSQTEASGRRRYPAGVHHAGRPGAVSRALDSSPARSMRSARCGRPRPPPPLRAPASGWSSRRRPARPAATDARADASAPQEPRTIGGSAAQLLRGQPSPPCAPSRSAAAGRARRGLGRTTVRAA